MEKWLGKPWFKSLTAWGLLVFFGLTALIDQACAEGLLSHETCATLQGWSRSVGGVLTVLGLRKAATAKNVAVVLLPMLVGCAMVSQERFDPATGNKTEDRFAFGAGVNSVGFDCSWDAESDAYSGEGCSWTDTFGISEAFRALFETLTRTAGSVFGASGEMPSEITVRTVEAEPAP